MITDSLIRSHLCLVLVLWLCPIQDSIAAFSLTDADLLFLRSPTTRANNYFLKSHSLSGDISSGLVQTIDIFSKFPQNSTPMYFCNSSRISSPAVVTIGGTLIHSGDIVDGWTYTILSEYTYSASTVMPGEAYYYSMCSLRNTITRTRTHNLTTAAPSRTITTEGPKYNYTSYTNVAYLGTSLTLSRQLPAVEPASASATITASNSPARLGYNLEFAVTIKAPNWISDPQMKWAPDASCRGTLSPGLYGSDGTTEYATDVFNMSGWQNLGGGVRAGDYKFRMRPTTPGTHSCVVTFTLNGP